jgi:nucleotide-binding universal stress UspA family protein
MVVRGAVFGSTEEAPKPPACGSSRCRGRYRVGTVFSTVAVGTDGSPTAREAVGMAADLARRFDAKLVLLSAFEDSPRVTRQQASASSSEVEWISSSSAQVREILVRTEDELRRQGIDCTTRSDEGDPADVLVQLAMECEADLLVVGNKGMRRRVLGSVPNTVTHNASCSVLVVKTT